MGNASFLPLMSIINVGQLGLPVFVNRCYAEMYVSGEWGLIEWDMSIVKYNFLTNYLCFTCQMYIISHY